MVGHRKATNPVRVRIRVLRFQEANEKCKLAKTLDLYEVLRYLACTVRVMIKQKSIWPGILEVYCYFLLKTTKVSFLDCHLNQLLISNMAAQNC